MREPTLLSAKHTVELTLAAPFNFDASLHKPDHFPSPDNAWEPGSRWQTMLWEGRRLGLKFENAGTVDRPKVALTAWSDEPLAPAFFDRLAAEIGHRCCFQLDLSDFYRRFEGEARLEPILARWRGMRPLNLGTLYEYLIIAIVLQNATVRRSVSMLRALLEGYGTPLDYDGKTLYCPWAPETLHAASEAELRELKVGYRAKSLKRVTTAFVEGQIDEFTLRARTRDEQRRALLGLYGIGPASVGYLLFDVFHHLDELDHISPWEQKIYSKLFFDADPENPAPVSQLLGYFDAHFAGYRMLAIHYFWEDLFWRRKHEPVAWLEKLIRL